MEKWDELFFVLICFILAAHHGCYASSGKKSFECYQTWVFITEGKSFAKHSSIAFMHEVVLIISKMQSAYWYKKKSLSIKYSRGRIKMYDM